MKNKNQKKEGMSPMKKTTVLLSILLALCLIAINPLHLDGAPQKKKGKLSYKEKQRVLKHMNQRYKHWWNLVYYISTEDEKDVFLALGSDRDRDVFMKAFWRQRDPTPGTVENEYKLEIENRFIYVQRMFKRGSPRPGWQTDMGRFYMILGKPSSIEYFDSEPGLYPAQVWYFYGDKTLGLPTYFNITFFKPHGTTEWKFYNPSMDGPAALIIRTEGAIDDSNYEALYKKIRELAPTLAMPALTMIPNEFSPGYRPPLRNNIIISNIHESPKRKINASYATHFLNYKGYVDTEASVNYVANSNKVSITRYGAYGFNFVNVSLKPKKISVGFSEEKNQFFFNYALTVTLKKGKTYIYEYKKNFDFYIDKDKVGALKSNGIIIHDTFPAIPGKYTLSVFAMNSVGKEFTYFEKKVDIPGSGPSQKAVLATPVIGYKAESQGDSFFYPFRFADRKLFVETERNLRLKENPVILLGAYNLTRPVWEKAKVEIIVKGLNERKKYSKTHQIELKQYPFKQNINAFVALGGEEGFDPDYYEVSVNLIGAGGAKLDSKRAQFSISPLRNVAYAMETFKKMRAENPYFFYFTLGAQYQKAEMMDKAEQYYTKAVESNPQFKAGYVYYLDILNKKKKYTQVLVEVENLKGDKKFVFDFHRIKALAHYGMKEYKVALDHLLKANTIYDSDVRVLNLLGFTFLNLDSHDEAVKAFNASLELDAKQAHIKETLEKVKKNGAKK